MHEQVLIQTLGDSAEPTWELGAATPFSLEGSGGVPRLTAVEQNTQSLIDTVLFWLSARECVHASLPRNLNHLHLIEPQKG